MCKRRRFPCASVLDCSITRHCGYWHRLWLLLRSSKILCCHVQIEKRRWKANEGVEDEICYNIICIDALKLLFTFRNRVLKPDLWFWEDVVVYVLFNRLENKQDAGFKCSFSLWVQYFSSSVDCFVPFVFGSCDYGLMRK